MKLIIHDKRDHEKNQKRQFAIAAVDSANGDITLPEMLNMER